VTSRALSTGTLAGGVCALWLASSALAGAQTAANRPSTADWTRVITVNDEKAEGQVLQMIFHQVSATGIGGTAAAAVLKRVGAYIDTQIERRGQATLNVGLVVATVEAAKAANWSADDMSRFAVALHREYDRQPPPDVAQLQKVAEKVRKGAKPADVLGVGETMKDPVPPAH
jgi:hypothetical protein